MTKPFKNDFILTQGFGENPDSYKRFGLLGHNGLDYGLPTGTEVIAPHDGKIIEATNDPLGYGNYLKIENDKEGSVLAHLKDFLVKAGDIVKEGQVIAHSDNTGNSTGPHLHWGYYLFPRDRSNGYAGFIDQLSLISNSQQAIIDELRVQRDNNWNSFQEEVTKNTKITKLLEEVKKQYEDEQKHTIELQDQIEQAHKEMADIANQNKDYGQQILDSQHERDDYLDTLNSLKDALSAGSISKQDLLDVVDRLKQPTEEIVKQVIPVMEEMHKNLVKGKIKNILEWLKLGINILLNK